MFQQIQFSLTLEMAIKYLCTKMSSKMIAIVSHCTGKA